MKVLQINSVCGIRSTGRIASDICNYLIERGNECLICYGRGNAANVPETSSYRIGTRVNVLSHAALSRLTDKGGFYSKSTTKKLIDTIRLYDPDVIHLHNIHGYYMSIDILFKYLASCQKPVVWTLHDCWAFTGHCTYFEEAGCRRWKDGCFDCPQKSEYPKSLLLDSSRENYLRKKELFTSIKDMTIVTPSKWLSLLAGESFLKGYEARTVYNGIDLDIFRPTVSDFKKRYGIEDKKVVLGVASVWDERKGFSDFLKMASLLPPSYRAVMVGLTERQMRDLPENIIGIGRTDSKQHLAQIYSAADIFANTTHDEVLGLVNLEAMACGTPVVTFDSGGSAECIDGKSGIAVKKGDVEGMVKAILEADFSADGAIARASLFDGNRTCEEYLKIYEGCLV